MNMLRLSVIAGSALTVAGCVCQNCCDLEARIAAIEKTPAVARGLAKPEGDRKVRTLKAPPKETTSLAAVQRKLSSAGADPALRTAAQVRFDTPKIVRQWENDKGTITRVILKSGVLSTNEVPKIVIEGNTNPTKYSKKAIGDALARLGYWVRVKEMLQTTEVENGRTAWDVWMDAAWFLENDPVFKGALEKAKQTLGITQEQLDALLKNCIY